VPDGRRLQRDGVGNRTEVLANPLLRCQMEVLSIINISCDMLLTCAGPMIHAAR